MDNTNCFLQNIYIPLKIESKEQQLALDYLKSRGISTDTAEKYDIQYCVENGVVGLIIQTGDKSFVTRFINPKDPDMRYRKRGSTAFFNFAAIEKNEAAAIFITEGEFDCLSILQAGYEAVSLGGVANVSKFMSELKNTGKRTPLILALDNDRAGRDAIAEMKEQAKALGIACLTPSLSGVKDINELLCKDSAAFEHKIQKWYLEASKLPKVFTADEEKRWQKFFQNRMDTRECAISQTAKCIGSKPKIGTGFSLLDDVYGGGIREGITVLGGAPSNGKSTFYLQFAANLAVNGLDVLFFSYEMSAPEIHAKNVVRTHYLNGNKIVSLSTNEIIRGEVFQKVGKEKIYMESCKHLKSTYDHLFLFNGGEMNIKNIQELVNEYISVTGRTPAVFIDYLRMIPGTNDRYTDKQNIDKIMLVLRQMKNQGIPLFVISSLSRASYDSPISMSSFKESGNIEFGTDVALALDFEAMYNNIDKKTGKSTIDLNYERRRDPRKVVLTVLKNRMGEAGTQISYDFYPDKNIFKECGVFYPHF